MTEPDKNKVREAISGVPTWAWLLILFGSGSGAGISTVASQAKEICQNLYPQMEQAPACVEADACCNTVAHLAQQCEQWRAVTP